MQPITISILKFLDLNHERTNMQSKRGIVINKNAKCVKTLTVMLRSGLIENPMVDIRNHGEYKCF